MTTIKDIQKKSLCKRFQRDSKTQTFHFISNLIKLNRARLAHNITIFSFLIKKIPLNNHLNSNKFIDHV